MSARDRIRAVADSLREPRSFNWISEQADAAWSTTTEELQTLVKQGQLRRIEAGETTRYQPDYTRLLFEKIRSLIEENTREELRNELAAITEEIAEWQATYDVETREELEQSLADGDLSSDELHHPILPPCAGDLAGFHPIKDVTESASVSCTVKFPPLS